MCFGRFDNGDHRLGDYGISEGKLPAHESLARYNLRHGINTARPAADTKASDGGGAGDTEAQETAAPSQTSRSGSGVILETEFPVHTSGTVVTHASSSEMLKPPADASKRPPRTSHITLSLQEQAAVNPLHDTSHVCPGP